MAEDESGTGDEAPPWPQQLYDSIWLIAGAAVVFWFLSYVLWGLIDIVSVPGVGG